MLVTDDGNVVVTTLRCWCRIYLIEKVTNIIKLIKGIQSNVKRLNTGFEIFQVQILDRAVFVRFSVRFRSMDRPLFGCAFSWPKKDRLDFVQQYRAFSLNSNNLSVSMKKYGISTSFKIN